MPEVMYPFTAISLPIPIASALVHRDTFSTLNYWHFPLDNFSASGLTFSIPFSLILPTYFLNWLCPSFKNFWCSLIEFRLQFKFIKMSFKVILVFKSCFVNKGWMDEWMDRWMDGWMGVQITGLDRNINREWASEPSNMDSNWWLLKSY